MLSSGMPRGLRFVALLAVLTVCSDLSAAEPEEPGFNELVVLDPGVDEQGLPAVEVTEDGQVEIPPTLHVHRYYYSGDKEYQGPILQGGPTIVVANHPKTGKKMYIDVTLPPGAPVIAYNKRSITYVYPNQRVVIDFPPLIHDRAIVKLVHGRGWTRGLRDTGRKIKGHLKRRRQQSQFSQELLDFARGTGNVVKGAAGVASKVRSMMVDRARAVAQIIPGVQALESLGKQSAERKEIEEVRQAGLKQARESTRFIPTLR